MTVRAVSWAAVSSKPQAKGESLADQHRLNHALAEALEWEIMCNITVPGESRSYHRLGDAREGVEAYRELCDLAASGGVQWVVCKSRDRLGRTRRLNREVADFLQDHNVRVYSRAIPPGNLSERGEAEVWGEAIESGFSEAEILRLKQRREMGMQARVRKGKLASRLPWGFAYVHRDGVERLELTDARAEEAARFAIARFHKGLSKLSIVAEARERGLRTAWGKKWTLNTVNQVVYQCAYYGLASWGRRRFVREDGRRKRKKLPPDEWMVAEGDFDAPFTPRDWRRTLAEHKRRADEHPRRRKARFPLSGIAWCAECDLPLIGTSSAGYLYYRCSHKWGPEEERGRKRHSIRDSELHAQVGEYLRRLVENPVMVRELMERAESRSEEETGRVRVGLRERQNELLRQRARWQDAYGTGVIGLEEFAEQLRGIESEEVGVEKRLEETERDLEDIERRHELHAWIKEAAAEVPRMLASELTGHDREVLHGIFQRLFKRVYVRDKRLTGAVELNV